MPGHPASAEGPSQETWIEIVQSMRSDWRETVSKSRRRTSVQKKLFSPKSRTSPANRGGPTPRCTVWEKEKNRLGDASIPFPSWPQNKQIQESVIVIFNEALRLLGSNVMFSTIRKCGSTSDAEPAKYGFRGQDISAPSRFRSTMQTRQRPIKTDRKNNQLAWLGFLGRRPPLCSFHRRTGHKDLAHIRFRLSKAHKENSSLGLSLFLYSSPCENLSSSLLTSQHSFVRVTLVHALSDVLDGFLLFSLALSWLCSFSVHFMHSS